jgi:phospholipid/cholesterol/gamma-HCH transport system permease protein
LTGAVAEAWGIQSVPLVLERIGQWTRRTLAAVGSIARFVRDVAAAFADVRTWAPETIGQARRLGVDSLPLGLFIAAFTGIVLALLASYSFTGAVPMYFVGTLVGKTVMLELAPVLTGLALAGRVGANIAAELGTMRVTEQIDALTALATEPIHYLIVPRVAAATVMLPLLVLMADAVGIGGGYLVAVDLLGANPVSYMHNSFQFLELKDLMSGILKAAVFGLLFSTIGCQKGFYTEGGAEGVGISTTRAVVAGSLAILLADFFLTKVLF